MYSAESYANLNDGFLDRSIKHNQRQHIPFHNCDTLGNADCHFYEDATLSIDAATWNSWSMATVHACASALRNPLAVRADCRATGCSYVGHFVTHVSLTWLTSCTSSTISCMLNFSCSFSSLQFLLFVHCQVNSAGF